MRRIEIRGPRLGIVRIVASVAVAALLAGCFLSDVPAITELTAEDVGSRLEYSGEPDTGPESSIRFARLDGKEYQMQFVDLDTGEVHPHRNGIFLRQLGLRGENPVYLVQHDKYRSGDTLPGKESFYFYDDDRFEFYPVEIRPDGVGMAATVDCADAETRTRAALHSVDLRCYDWAGMCLLPRISNEPDEAQIIGFLQEVLQEGLYEWEDNGGLDIYGECLQ